MPRIRFIACLLRSLAGCSPRQHPDSNTIAGCLDELIAGKTDWNTFSITYDDLHGFHGGLTLTIYGDGRVEQKAIGEKVGEARKVPRQELERLVQALQEVRAWKQQTPERTPVPDESTARLTIRCSGKEVKIWEWYNEMSDNNRLIRVRELMKQISWQ